MPDIVEVDQVFQQRHELRPLDETIVSRVGSLVRLDIPSKPLEGKRDIVKKTRRKRKKTEENGRKREENGRKREEKRTRISAGLWSKSSQCIALP